MNRREPLVPCPFCRSTDIRASEVPFMVVFLSCHKCGATGPTFPAGKKTVEDKWPTDAARDGWNTRP